MEKVSFFNSFFHNLKMKLRCVNQNTVLIQTD